MISQQDLKNLKQATPYVRSILSFCLYITFGGLRTTPDCYKKADEFIKQLTSDVMED